MRVWEEEGIKEGRGKEWERVCLGPGIEWVERRVEGSGEWVEVSKCQNARVSECQSA